MLYFNIKSFIMKDNEELTKEIIYVTTKIQTDYPELYQFLMETPNTITTKPGTQVKFEDLEKHLQMLNKILMRYIETKSWK